ncbi:hypothetical protein BJY00DRAFT_287177 [Aspergillus carlsbadensis]|nr:hypothetical protein BJY00DRAFT_287177 [Aspergillus carlsbadensis]
MDEKPTSLVLTAGVPAIITGIIVLTGVTVCCILFHRRQRHEDRADERYRAKPVGYYELDRR